MSPAAQRAQAPSAAAPAASATSALDDLLGLSSALEATSAPAPAQPQALSLEPRPSLTPALFQGKWGALQPAQRFTLPLPPSALAAIEANGHQVLEKSCILCQPAVVCVSHTSVNLDCASWICAAKFCLLVELPALRLYSCTDCKRQPVSTLYMLQGFLQSASSMGIATMASGGKSPVFRFYMYAKPQARAEFLLVEAVVDKSAANVTVTIKSENAPSVPAFADLYRSCLNGMTR